MRSQQQSVERVAQRVPAASTIGAVSLAAQSVLFHGINKSGSLAMSEVFGRAYSQAGREDEFMCRYVGKPGSREEALGTFAAKLGQPQLLIDHGLVGIWASFPSAKYITLLRDPVRRLVSCYYWLCRFHPEGIRGRDLMRWAIESGKGYTMCFQFACHAGPGAQVKHDTRKLSSADIAARGRSWFDEHVSAYGVAENFEESVLWLGSHLGLAIVPAWTPDLRNTGRPKWESLDADTAARLQELLRHDIEFYEALRKRFLSDTRLLRATTEAEAYREACAASRWEQQHYGSDERIEVRSPIADEVTASEAEALHQLLADRLRDRGLRAGVEFETTGLRLVTRGLPPWWEAGNNALYVDANNPAQHNPVITYPKTQPPPTNALIVVRCRDTPALKLWGDGGAVYMAGNVALPKASIACGEAALVVIGPRTRSTAAVSIDARNGGAVVIEGDCLMGGNCRLQTDDMHAILDASSGRRVNRYGGHVFVGEHVWLGAESILQGDCEIERDCVIRPRSLAAGRFGAGSLVEGAPAAVTRDGVTWDPKDIPG